MLNFLAGKMTFIEHYTPQQVLIAHILHRFSDFKEWSASVQVQVRFLFDQFSRGLINESSFRQMTQEFNPFLRHAADMLITAISYPGRIRYCVKSQRWSHEETTILLAGYFLNRISQVSHILPHRPPRCFKAHVETVVLLSQQKPDDTIEIDLDLDELDATSAETKATYEEIKEYVKEKYQLKVSNLYISQIKRKCGIEVGINYNLPKSENSRVPQCPPEKEKAIREALEYFQMIS